MAHVKMNALVSASPVSVDPLADFDSVRIVAPTTIASSCSGARRSRSKTLARRAANGGKRLSSRTACAALVALAPNADNAFEPGPNAMPHIANTRAAVQVTGGSGRGLVTNASIKNKGDAQNPRATKRSIASK
jgi:hypothetical protein